MVVCLVAVYVCSFVPSLIQPRVSNIFLPNLKYSRYTVVTLEYCLANGVPIGEFNFLNFYFDHVREAFTLKKKLFQ